MPSYAAYIRKIVVGNQTLTTIIDGCSFTWGMNGCENCTLTIGSADFDDFMDVEIGDDIQIYYSSTERFWRGIVVELSSNFDGLTIQGVGTKTYLAEAFPSGRFGNAFALGEPTNGAATVGASGDAANALADGTYSFMITAVDEEGGESWTGSWGTGGSDGFGRTYGSATVDDPDDLGKKVTVTWTAAANAVGYRVYWVFNTYSFTLSQGCQVIDVGSTTFTLYGNTTGEPADLPFDNEADVTGVAPTIADADLESIINYLLDNHLPDTITKGAVDLEDLNEDIDDFDLRQGSDDLQKILDALVDLAGECQWYVDEDNQIHFTKLATDYSYTFVVKSSDLTINEVDVPVDISRSRTRDGVTQVKIEGAEQLADENVGQGTLSWSREIVTGYWWNEITSTGGYSAHSTSIPAGATTIVPTRAFIDGYATLADWLAVFPNQRWVYIAKDSLSDSQLTTYLTRLRDVGQAQTYTTNGPRPRMVTKKMPGIRTALAAGIVGNNFLLKYVPNPETWAISLERITRVYRPGTIMVRVKSNRGKYYKVRVKGASYSFDSTPNVIIDAGDLVYDPYVEQADILEVVRALSMRKSYPTVWR